MKCEFDKLFFVTRDYEILLIFVTWENKILIPLIGDWFKFYLSGHEPNKDNPVRPSLNLCEMRCRTMRDKDVRSSLFNFALLLFHKVEFS